MTAPMPTEVIILAKAKNSSAVLTGKAVFAGGERGRVVRDQYRLGGSHVDYFLRLDMFDDGDGVGVLLGCVPKSEVVKAFEEECGFHVLEEVDG